MLTSCSQENNKPIVISTNAWIGYSPLFYAREMGWLKEANVELISVVSLGESMHLYNAGSSDLFTGTQHEFLAQREIHDGLIPIMLMDKSNGGDMIMSNRTIEELKQSDQKIDVYLEMGSINQDLLEYFITKEGISKDRLNILNRIQDEIKLIENTPKSPMTLIITYNPYNLELVQNGFTEIESTKTSNNLIVVDAIYTSSGFYAQHEAELQKLDKIIDKALAVLQKDPKAYYEKVKLYLDNPTYEEFLEMNNNIVWLHEKLTPSDQESLSKIAFPIKDIIR